MIIPVTFLSHTFVRMKNVCQLEITLTSGLCVFVEKRNMYVKKWLQEKLLKIRNVILREMN